MFGFLKDKLKKAIGKFSKDVDDESEEIIEESQDISKETIESDSDESQEDSKDELEKQEEKPKDVDKESEEKIEDESQEEKEESIEKDDSDSSIEAKDESKEPKVESQSKEQESSEEQEIKEKASEIEVHIKEEVKEFQEDKDESEEKIKEVIEQKEEKSKEEEKQEEQENQEQESEEDKAQEVKRKESIKEEKHEVKSELEKPLIVEDDEIDDVKDTLPKPKELKEEIKEEKEIEKLESEEKVEKKSFFQKIKDKIISKDKDKEEEDELNDDSKLEESKETFEDETDKTIELKTGEESEKEDDSVDMIIEDDVIKKSVEIENDEEILKEKEEKVVDNIQDEVKKFKEEKPSEKKGFFSKLADSVTKTSISESKFNDLFWELEIVLLENNVAVEVIDKIKEDLKIELVTKKARFGKTQDVIIESLQKTINSLFDVNQIDLFEEIKKKKPYVIIFVGVNGVGKTTTIAKLAHLLIKNNKTCVMAAGDTFRAAAIQQLEEHAKKLNVRLISHDYGSDPAAVAFDAIKYAEAKGIDVVLIDTAGRQHSNSNLMAEMKKIQRVTTPDLKIFVGESITGNDCVEQAKSFNESIGIDAMILSKADVDEKGGAAISISYVTKKPILYIGTGQEYDCLKEFNKELVTENLGLK
jgi:fused signal recognition particle receptor